jgi:hypothetical protein
MPFLGVEPVQEFASVAKQTITGDGSTAYTLTHSVGSANDLAVFVNNVRQEPTTAYSASGATITFTEAIASTDSCYVMYIARTFSSANAEANSVGITELNVSDGSNGQALTTNGSGTLSFATVTTATPTLAAVTGAGATTTNAVTIGNLTSTGIDDNATSTAITINSSENVGIGTTSPDSGPRLHLSKGSAGTVDSHANSVLTIEDDSTAILQFLTPANEGAQIRFGDPDSNGVGLIEYGHGTNNLNFHTAGSERMRINSSGKVGINNTNPSELLSMIGTGGTAKVRFDGDASNLQNNFIGITGYDDLIIASDEANSGTASTIQFRVDGSERMRIDANGYVTKPSTPVFSYGAYTTYTVTGTGTQVVSTSTAWNNSSYVHINYNNGSHFNASNGRFTAPVAGIYRFDFKAAVSNHSSGYFWWYIYKNASSAIAYWQSTQGMTSGSDDYALAYMQVYINLAANDYIDVRWANNYAASQKIHYPHFSGALVA